MFLQYLYTVTVWKSGISDENFMLLQTTGLGNTRTPNFKHTSFTNVNIRQSGQEVDLNLQNPLIKISVPVTIEWVIIYFACSILKKINNSLNRMGVCIHTQ